MIIGLVGPAGAGKGTVADMLMDEGYVKVAFADTLKNVVSEIFCWPRHWIEGDFQESREFREKEDPYWSEKFGYSVTPRKMLQLMGTEAGRDVFHPDIWIHTLERKIQGLENVVIPDVRFPNEIDFVKRNGGVIVRVSRKDPPHIESLDDMMIINGFTKFPDDDWVNEFMWRNFPEIHLSEYAWWNTPADYLIDNIGTLEDLRKQVIDLTFNPKPNTIFHHSV